MTERPQERWMELSDVIVDFRADGSRHPVAVADAARALGDTTARSFRILESFPHDDGVLDDEAVDEVLVRSHLELQRLAEEIQHGQRVARLIRPFLDLIEGPKTVVDVGCGLGYLVRYFAHTRSLGHDVNVVGFDFNQTLLSAARDLAAIEGLEAEFIAGDAFQLDRAATVFISSGVIHHFGADELPDFFARQYAAGAKGCFHFDVAPTPLTPLGAWLFHWARMREPLARHDGVRSALRAHDDAALATGLKRGAPEWAPLLFDAVGRRMAVLNVMRPIVGMDPDLVGPYRAALGRLSSRLADA